MRDHAEAWAGCATARDLGRLRDHAETSAGCATARDLGRLSTACLVTARGLEPAAMRGAWCPLVTLLVTSVVDRRGPGNT
ncbi:MAG TPA: hypothetical protein VL738_37985 [Dactylosporangium sp.]|nr:hypothetical protein [Dactylosporangium sp.]